MKKRILLKKLSASVLGISLLCLLITPGYAGTSTEKSAAPGPLPDAKVLFIFVDSLRPDMVDNMVREGRLPNIKKFFYDQGLRFPNFFSQFPSLTVNAYGSLITGKWQNESGLKAQSLFERYPTHQKNFWKRIFFIREDYPRYANMLTKLDAAPKVLKQNKVKALYDLLGEQFHPSIVPISPYVTPWAWPHVAANDVEHPYFVTTEAHDKLDDINGNYAVRYIATDTRYRLAFVWFTELDTEQHRDNWGPFGEASKKMEKVDLWMGKIYDAITRNDTKSPFYVVLFSDHGSYGGAGGIYNQPFYLGRDFFYKTLKMNVRGPDYTITHLGTDLNAYTYIDNMGRGQARIFLPLKQSGSKDWSRPNTLNELRRYGLGPNRGSVDLIQELLNIDLSSRNEFPGKVDPHPVEFVFLKLASNLIGIFKQDGSQAVIHYERRDGKDWYRYIPVENLSQDAAGKISYTETSVRDPFNYFNDPQFHAFNTAQFLREYHNDSEWLAATYETDYPEAVTALVKSLSWNPRLEALAQSQDPDLCLSAKSGWNFRIEDIHGADHGAISKGALRSTLMFSGPNIRKGIDPTPHRILEVTPTLIQMLGHKGKTEFDAVPIEGLYES